MMHDDNLFERAADVVIAGDVATLASMLRDTPGLVFARSAREHRVTLLHYVGANLVEDIGAVRRSMTCCGGTVRRR